MINQLRTYEIFAANRQAFLDRFRDHAARLMADHGFRIQAMWEMECDGRLFFVYLLAWTDAAEMDARWAAFMANQEWKDIKARTAAEHGNLVGEIESAVLTPTDFSAAIGSAT